jgi:protein subunit release factor A
MTKNIKNDLENNKTDNASVIGKMDDVFTKLGDLEQKLAQMDQVMAKIDQLGMEVQQIKPETPVEKLEMRSLDSYPFNEKPAEFFDHKQDEMRASGKNEYILTKDDVENYDPTIMTSFNPEEDKDEYSF